MEIVKETRSEGVSNIGVLTTTVGVSDALMCMSHHSDVVETADGVVGKSVEEMCANDVGVSGGYVSDFETFTVV